MNDDLDIGPSVLAPGAPLRPDTLARLLLWPLFVMLFTVTVLFYVMFSALHVDGDSMEPALHHGERILRTKSYDDPERGDIVIIDTESSAATDDIVKRVVALAGDTIEIRDDVALVNGAVESVASPIRFEGYGMNMKPVVIPEGHVFVMGDNRPVSLDSRILGAIPLSKIRGRAEYVFLPLGDARRL